MTHYDMELDSKREKEKRPSNKSVEAGSDCNNEERRAAGGRLSGSGRSVIKMCKMALISLRPSYTGIKAIM